MYDVIDRHNETILTIMRLRKENERLKKENEHLKKILYNKEVITNANY